MITHNKIRAARALLGWGQAELARRSGLSTSAIANIELKKQKPSTDTVKSIRDAFKTGGVEIEEDGVKYIDDVVTIIEKSPSFNIVLEDAKAVLKKGDQLCLLGRDARSTPKDILVSIDELINKGVVVRNIMSSEHIFIHGDPKDYRCLPKDYFTFSDVIAIYSNTVATVIRNSENSKDKDYRIMIIRNKQNADDYKRIFKFMWDHSKQIKKYKDVRDYETPMIDHYTKEQMRKLAREK